MIVWDEGREVVRAATLVAPEGFFVPFLIVAFELQTLKSIMYVAGFIVGSCQEDTSTYEESFHTWSGECLCLPMPCV